MTTNPNAPVEIPRSVLEQVRDLVADVEHHTLMLTREAATIALETPALAWSGEVTTSDIEESARALAEAHGQLATLVLTLQLTGVDPVRLYAEYRNL